MILDLHKKFSLKIYILIFAGELCGSMLAQQTTTTSQFIVTPRKKGTPSKTDLKEDIGLEMKQLLNYSANIRSNIAKLQLNLSQLDFRMLRKIEALIDGKPPFKRTVSKNLKEALNLLQRASLKMNSVSKAVEDLKGEMDKHPYLKN